MKEKILVAGGNGFVGSNFSLLAKERGYNVVIADSSKSEQLKELTWVCFDIRNKGEVDRHISRIKPSAIVNVAAISNIDMAEINRKETHAVNVDGALHLARSAKINHLKYIFISSDAVFDGKNPPFSETSPVDPVNYYGKTKAMAETAVLGENPTSIVVRLSLVLGASITQGNSFLMGFAERLQKGDKITMPSNEIRTPVDVHTLSECLLELIEAQHAGIIHLGTTEAGSKYAISREIARKMGYDPSLVIESNDAPPGRALRHLLGILNVSRAGELLKTRMLNLEETIDRSLSGLPKSYFK